MPTLTFLGAARTVTGSKHLLEINGSRILVDCGLFQGLKDLRLKNWEKLPIDAASITAVVLTHAHLDHSGYLPRLVAEGFKGRIFCTPGTKDLCQLVLTDSAKIQEEDARQANRHAYTRHHPALPLFTAEDAAAALRLLQPVGFDRPVPVAEGVEVSFHPAGHLLGSAWVRLRASGRETIDMVFGGDLGRYGRPVLPDPTPCDHADILLVESTYGNRLHAANDEGAQLAEIINATWQRGGKVIIPSFAIGRVEEVLYWIKRLEDEKKIPALPVYVDSPMALAALEFYSSRTAELDPDIQRRRHEVSAFCTTRFNTVETPQRSKEVMQSTAPSIVISSSGMATGGRVLHHLQFALPDPRHTVLFVGFQAAGTRGRMLVGGAPFVKIHGQMIPVQARIEKIDSMSAHADQSEIMRWLGAFVRPPKRTFLVHGEPDAMTLLSQLIASKLGWEVEMPRLGDTVDLAPILAATPAPARR